MSALPLSTPRPARAEPARRRLEVVAPRPDRRARPRLLPAIITMGGIGAILLAQLLLSIVLADGAYRIAELQGERRDLERREEALTEQLEVLSSTQNLTANAEHLGMVASGNPVFLDLSTGAVSGNPTPAGGSLTGSGNRVGNALLTGATLVDPAARGAGGASSGSTDGAAGSPAGGTGNSPGTGGSGGTGGSAPGTIPSPTTR